MVPCMSEEEPVLLEATLRPSPPLPLPAVKLVVCAVALINLCFGLAFVLRGAWLVTPFMGLDVALLAWAFHASLRDAKRHERVRLTASKLVVERYPPKGPPTAVALNPYWVRVDLDDAASPRALTLWSHGRGVAVGSFLAPEVRAGFARSLKAALREARERR